VKSRAFGVTLEHELRKALSDRRKLAQTDHLALTTISPHIMSVMCKVLIPVRRWTLATKNPKEPESDEAGSDLSKVASALQQKLFAGEPDTALIELYRRQEMLELHCADWQMALQIFNEMGWTPERPLDAYATPLAFVKNYEGEAMQY